MATPMIDDANQRQVAVLILDTIAELVADRIQRRLWSSVIRYVDANGIDSEIWNSLHSQFFGSGFTTIRIRQRHRMRILISRAVETELVRIYNNN